MTKKKIDVDSATVIEPLAAELHAAGVYIIDSHCHLHDSEYDFDAPAVLERARKAGVRKIILAGTSYGDSLAAVEFARAHDGVFALVGWHPEEISDAKSISESVAEIEGMPKMSADSTLEKSKIVGIGEIGLDYHYEKNPEKRARQCELLEAMLKLAVKYDLPACFHIREAFDDFFPIFDRVERETGARIRGVLHSFTGTMSEMKKGLERGLYFGVNGIATFNKDELLNEVYHKMPLERILLETDAPFLTPTPFRGRTNEPEFTIMVAKHLADVYNVSFVSLAETTTRSAETLYNLD
jgi:TatD DNase family protein